MGAEYLRWNLVTRTQKKCGVRTGVSLSSTGRLTVSQSYAEKNKLPQFFRLYFDPDMPEAALVFQKKADDETFELKRYAYNQSLQIFSILGRALQKRLGKGNWVGGPVTPRYEPTEGECGVLYIDFRSLIKDAQVVPAQERKPKPQATHILRRREGVTKSVPVQPRPSAVGLAVN